MFRFFPLYENIWCHKLSLGAGGLCSGRRQLMIFHLYYWSLVIHFLIAGNWAGLNGAICKHGLLSMLLDEDQGLGGGGKI